MVRRAVLIGNSGVRGSILSQELKGVEMDLKVMYDFLRSDNGGAWRKNEIIAYEPNNVNKSELLNRISEERKIHNVDFWFVVFTGHGWSDENGNDYLEIIPEELDKDSDCSIEEIVQAIGPNSRLVLITDSCRKVVPINESLEPHIKVKYFSDTPKASTPYRQKCRELYNEQVELMPSATYFIAQSCSFDETSNDNEKYGGEYIHALIGCANEAIASERANRRLVNSHIPTTIFTLRSVHYCANRKVSTRTFDKQHPTIKGSRGTQPPFAVMPVMCS